LRDYGKKLLICRDAKDNMLLVKRGQVSTQRGLKAKGVRQKHLPETKQIQNKNIERVS